MKLCITNEGIGILSENKNVVLYRTVDNGIVISASCKIYSQVFSGRSNDIVERKIHNELYDLMKKMSRKYEEINNLHDNGFASIIRYYGNDMDNLLKLQKDGDDILFEVKKLDNDDIYNVGRVEVVDQDQYKDVFSSFFQSLLNDITCTRNKVKVKK